MQYIILYHCILVPSGPPQSITFSKTSRTVSIFWMPIICSQCNGPITNYLVDFQSFDGFSISGSVINETFTASGLTPYTNYTFRVAGVNDNGTGPFSDTITILTDEDSEYMTTSV